MKCRIEIQDGTIVEVNEDAQLHFVKFETRQIEKCLDYIRDTLMNSEHFAQVRNCENIFLNPILYVNFSYGKKKVTKTCRIESFSLFSLL